MPPPTSTRHHRPGRVGSGVFGTIRTALLVAVILELNLIFMFSRWSSSLSNTLMHAAQQSRNRSSEEKFEIIHPASSIRRGGLTKRDQNLRLVLPSGDDFWSKLDVSLPTAPAGIIRRKHYFNKHEVEIIANDKCKTVPPPWKILTSNQFWQGLFTTQDDNTMNFYRAYYDHREKDVRVLLLSQRSFPDHKSLACLFWNSDGEFQEMTRVRESLYIRVPSTSTIPVAVSIVEKASLTSNCTEYPTNILTVDIKPAPKDFSDDDSEGIKKKVCVCTRPMIFSTPSIIPRLVEWMELLALLGADKVVFYYYYLSEDIRRALTYYEVRDRAQVIPILLPGKYTGDTTMESFLLNHDELLRIQTDIIAYNDCLYSHMYNHEYMTWLDIDETSYAFKNTFFMDDFLPPDAYAANGTYDQTVPEYHHMLRKLIRSAKHTPMMQCKSIHRARILKTVRSHHAGHCLGSVQCNTTYVHQDLAHLAHYRNGCMDALKSRCHEYTVRKKEDLGILKFKDKLVANTAEALQSMGFLV